MSSGDELAYAERREGEERARASAALDPHTARVHLVMAEAYASRAALLRGGGTPTLSIPE